MCSTPRPKTRTKGKSRASGSLLSSMSSEARSRFAERANLAQERRHQIAITVQKETNQWNHTTKTSRKAINQTIKKSQRNLSYWLVSASIKDIFLTLFFGKSKRT